NGSIQDGLSKEVFGRTRSEGSAVESRCVLHRQERDPREGAAQDPKPYRTHGQAAVPALRGRQPIPPRRAAGARRGRQGWRRSAWVQRDEPARDVRLRIQAAEQRGSRSRFLLARPLAHPGQGRSGDRQSIALRGCARGARAQARATFGVVETLRPDQRLRNDAVAKRHDHSEVLSPHQPGRTAGALQAAARRPGATLEDQRKRLFRTRAVAAIRGGVRGRHGVDEHEARALVHHSGKPQVVPQPSGIAGHRRHDGRHGVEVAADARRHRGYSPQVPRGGARAEDRRPASDEESRQGRIAAKPKMLPWLFASLHGYRIGWLPRDFLAGLMLAAIAIPGQLATARLAGMPPETGLYAFAAGSLAFAAFGANRFMSVAADSTIAPIFAGGLASFAALG